MKKMKRLLVFVLAGVLALAMLTACGSSVPVGEVTERAVKVKCKEYAQEALKDRGTVVADNAELQQIAADAIRENWEKGAAGMKEAKTKDGCTVMVVWNGDTVVNQDLPNFPVKKQTIQSMLTGLDDIQYKYDGAHAEKADVYTSVNGEEVLYAFVLQYPQTTK